MNSAGSNTRLYTQQDTSVPLIYEPVVAITHDHRSFIVPVSQTDPRYDKDKDEDRCFIRSSN